ncbi:MAG: leucine-rich repeat protein [Ruminococcus sp.]|nr:leucine-rich repeat protein [Ruminococcus sp.]
MKKRLLSLLTTLAMVAGLTVCLPTVAVSAEAYDIAYSTTIYGMTPSYEDVLSIPDSYAQNYQISDSDAVSYKVVSGDSVTVSSSGLIKPAYVTWYVSGFFYTTAYIEDADTYEELTTGESIVKVTTNNSSYYISVTVEDYSDVYVDQTIENYIDENISSDMTDYEIMEQICRFPALYDYDASYSSAKGMLIYGGGDCWASTSLIIKTCEKLGITAWIRNGNRDPGAGSGHRNAMAELNGVYYELEAGYDEVAPRSYTVTIRTSLFSTKNTTGGVEVYQYDGNESDLFELEIPSEIDGKTVVSIGDYFVSSNSYITKVTIPDTVTYIGYSAFNSCSSLTTLNIPASVRRIEEFAFTNCNALSDLSCDSENEKYTVENNILYNKDKTVIYFAQYSSEITVPSTVETIYEYSFYYNMNLTTVNIPESVTEIGEGAFGNCESLKSVALSEGLTSIGDYAFRSCGSLTSITIPDSVVSIGNYAFYYCDLLTSIIIPETVTSIGDGAFNKCDDLTIYCYSGSYAEQYAIDNEINYVLIDVMLSTVGDLNGDGKVTTADVGLANSHAKGVKQLNDIQFVAADMNDDGKVTTADVGIINAYAKGIR